MAAENDTQQHHNTYQRFMKLLTMSTAGVGVVLLLMLLFLV